MQNQRSLALASLPAGSAVVMVGPEGCFVTFEIELVCAVLDQRVHLGACTRSVDATLMAALALGA